MKHEDMFLYVKKILESNNAFRPAGSRFSFRNRFEHIRRVYNWCLRLLEDDVLCDKEVVLVSAIFHDVGYAFGKIGHAMASATVFKDYAKENNLDDEFVCKVVDVISNHSNKDLLKVDNISMELIILLEADLLDEEGALGIVWDLLAEGKNEPDAYNQALKAIDEHSGHILNQEYMVTPLAKKYWKEKQEFVRSFINELSNDLFLK